ncbi:hypothetical protein QE152_g37383 [Popillia japonica]|uniref:Uncharacterized protein n=1 Tax=Popillia japonica TaxID=7064 RepID=A0AAW1I9U0_POPJA
MITQSFLSTQPQLLAQDNVSFLDLEILPQNHLCKQFMVNQRCASSSAVNPDAKNDSLFGNAPATPRNEHRKI